MPAQPDALQPAGGDVGQLAEQRVEQDRQHHHVGLQKLAGVHRQVTDAGTGRDRLGDDQGQPHETEGEAHANQNRRQRAGQDHLAKQGESAESVAARHFHQRRVDVADAVVGVQIDGEQGAERNEKDLCALVDAEPEDHQRDQRQVRHVADHLHRAVEQTLAPGRQTGDETEQQADAAADGEADAGAPAANGQMGPELAAAEQLPAGRKHSAGRRQDAGGQQPEDHRALPGRQQRDRQGPRRQTLTKRIEGHAFAPYVRISLTYGLRSVAFTSGSMCTGRPQGRDLPRRTGFSPPRPLSSLLLSSAGCRWRSFRRTG